jgi:hypothetical protein
VVATAGSGKALSYVPRVVDGEIRASLAALGAVAIEGPKACGKTETARQHAASEVLLDLSPEDAEAARLDPHLVLEGATPRLIDEWQVVPTLWNAVRRAVDDRREPGQFLLTGSAQPADDASRHSGAGRFSTVRMRPMTMLERGRSSGAVSVGRLLDGEELESATCQVDVSDYAAEVVIGGWPALVDADEQIAARLNRGYIDAIVEVDIHVVNGVHRDPVRVRRFLHAFAQLVAHPAKQSTIVRRAAGIDTGEDAASPSRWSAAAYLDALTRLMLVEDQPSWRPGLRSRTRLVGTPKRHLADPSLAAAVLQRDRQGLLADLNTFGFLFESLVIRDLRVYSQVSGASVFHYREDKGDLEIDAVIERPDGAWAAFEIKLGSHEVDTAAAALRRLADRTSRPAASLAVVTTTRYAYKRDDGVAVIPAATLGP